MFRVSVCVASMVCATARAQVLLPFDLAIERARGAPTVTGAAQAAEAMHRAHEHSAVLDANPLVSVAAGARTTPVNERGFEGSLAVTQSFGVEGSASARRDALGGEAGWLDAELDAERLTRTLAVARAWLVLREAEQQLVGASAELENERQFLGLVGLLLESGELTTADRSAAEVRMVDARVRELTAEGALVDAQAAMAAELGAAPQGHYVTEGPLPHVADPDQHEVARLASASTELPAARARRLMARSELLRAREERAMRGVRFTVGVEVRRDALSALVAQGTFSSTLPFFAVGDREFSARFAASRRLEGEATDEQTRARALMAVAIHEVGHTKELFEALSARLVPATEQAVALRERQLQAGEATMLDVLDARRQRFEAQRRVIHATSEKLWALIRLATFVHAAGSNE